MGFVSETRTKSLRSYSNSSIPLARRDYEIEQVGPGLGSDLVITKHPTTFG